MKLRIRDYGPVLVHLYCYSVSFSTREKNEICMEIGILGLASMDSRLSVNEDFHYVFVCSND